MTDRVTVPPPLNLITGGYKAPGGTGTGSGNTRVGLTKGPNGEPEVYKSNSGSEARFGRDGKVREIHRGGITVVYGPVGVTGADGQECALSEGDVLRLSTPPLPGSTTAYLQVFASKNRDCVRGNTVSVRLEDLQEMQNHMRASIDRGLEELQAHQGGLAHASSVGRCSARRSVVCAHCTARGP